MLHYIDPNAELPDQVAVLTRVGCSFCAEAKTRLAEAGYEFVEVPLSHTVRARALGAIAGARTVPQVFINGERIGGLEQLEAFLAQHDGPRGAARRAGSPG